MSKSLGNSPDPLDLFENLVLMESCDCYFCASAGNDIMFDEELCNQEKVYQ
jgi:valyl-tRNA synthetase